MLIYKTIAIKRSLTVMIYDWLGMKDFPYAMPNKTFHYTKTIFLSVLTET